MTRDVESMVFGRNGYFPNSDLPVLVYRQAVEGAVTAEAVQSVFARNGWPPRWVDTIFDYYHYHSTAHEALGVVLGTGELAVGGPGERVLEIVQGDVVVLPAGVVHKLEQSSGNFAVVGAYPPGQDWDILKGEKGEWDMAIANISRVPLPDTDPVSGPDGPLPRLWNKG